MGPAQVWKTWKAGGYDVIENVPMYLEYVSDIYTPCRTIRLGSYGDPSMVPDGVLQQWRDAIAKGYTGYTHQWHKRPDLAGQFMASVDSIEEKEQAQAMGWYTFRVESDHRARPMKDETVCLNYRHASIKCCDCLLCDGKQRNVMIYDHGAYLKSVKKRRAA